MKKCEKEMALHICQLHNVHSSPVMKMAKLSGPTAVKIIRNGREKKTIRDSQNGLCLCC